MTDKHETDRAGERRICNDITAAIGGTPLVRLNRLGAGRGVELLVKLEFMNPLASVKDRIGLAMIEALEASGRIGPDTVIVEPTSGNTGIALAFVCAARGYNLVLTMPASMSVERRAMLAHLGARLELTPAEKGMRGAVDRAMELVRELPDAVMPQQFENPANTDIHERTTAEEIWADTGGRVDALVAGIGTGGTLTGIGRRLRRYNPDLFIAAIEPEDSAVLSGGLPGVHKIQGIGAGFVPAILDRDLIDEVITIGNETAFATARRMALEEGIPCGISSGAAMAATLEMVRSGRFSGKTIVTILPSMAERYLSTPLFDHEQKV